MNDQLKAKGFLVWGICALFFLYEFCLRTIAGTYQHPIMQDLDLTLFQFSLISSTVFLSIYGIMQVPAGLIVGHIGLKRSVLIGTICCAMSSIGFAYAYSYPIAFVFRMSMDLGASFGFVSLLISVYDWMPRKYSAVFIGLSQFIGTLGPMAVAGPLNSMSESTGISWHFVFLCFGGAGGLLALLTFLFVENNQQKSGKYIVLYRPEKVSTSISRLFSRIQPWYIALYSSGLYFSIEYLSENEGRAFLVLKGISMDAAAYMITIAWLGYAIRCPFWGFLSDIFERRKVIMKISAVLGLMAILMVLYLPVKRYLQIAFLLLGVSASGQSIGFAIMAEQFKKQFVAVGFGLNNAMIMVASAVNAPLIGFMLDSVRKVRAISLNDYLLVFSVLVIASVVSLVMAVFFIKETYCKSSVDFTVLKPASDISL